MNDWTKAVENLQSSCVGRVITPTDPEFGEATKIWARTKAHPVAVVRCRGVEDVQAAIGLARVHRLPLSVKGGGHDWAGRALCDGVVVDLSEMRDVDINHERRTARVGGGARARDLAGQTDLLGLAAATGAVGAVGLGGLVLGGGYGPIIARYGLACDNLVEAEVVLADGRVETASEGGDRELLWALKGGGGGFGVVTAMTLRLHEARFPLCGTIVYRLSDGPAVIACARELSAAASDDFTMQLALMADGKGQTVIVAVPTWVGSDDGDAWIGQLLTAAIPIQCDVGRRSFSAALSLFDGPMLDTRDVRIETCWVSDLSSEVSEIMIAQAAARPGPGCSIITHEFRGAASRVAPDAAAFGMRRPHTLIEIVAQSDGPERLEQERWAEETLAALLPHALAGGYANLLRPDDPRATLAYRPNLNRLISVKKRLDPTNLFRSALSLSGSGNPAASDANVHV